jgi:hypothetical protein
MAYNASQTVTSGSQIIILTPSTNAGVSSIVLQIDWVGSATWTGSFRPVRQLMGASASYQATYTSLQDGQIYSSSISTTGSFMLDTTTSQIYLSHSWTAGTASVWYSTVNG